MKSILIAILSVLYTTIIFSQPPPAPDFQLITTKGENIELYKDYLDQDKTVLLELFWEGCPPCNSFAPLLGELYEEWGSGNGDVEFIALDILLNENNADVEAFQNRHGHTWPGVSAEGGSVGATAPYKGGTVYGTYLGTPTIVIIAPDGTVAYNVNGFNRNAEGLRLLDDAIRATGAKKPTDDTNGPVFIQAPTSIANINCNDTLPNQEELVAMDTCGVNVVASIDEYIANNCDGYSITYRWVATDSCDNSTSQTTTFNVLPDTVAPVFDKLPNPIPNVKCGDPFPTPEALTAASQCGAAMVVFSIDDYTLDVCNGNTITYRWLATSACGKTTEAEMSFIITHDRQGPVFNKDPDPIPDIRCTSAFPLPEPLMATSNCTDVALNFSIDDFEEDFCNGYEVTYRWTATDMCGNSTVKTQNFNVLPDPDGIEFSKEPNMLSDIACGEAFPTPETLVAFDNCTTSPVTFSVERSSDEPCGRMITYRWVAIDPCGNEIQRTASFQVGGGEAITTTLTGNILNAKNEGVENVTLHFSGGAQTSIVTNSAGGFSVPDLPVDASYTIRPEKNGPINEGVTTFDIVLISRHILGSELFTDDTQLIAADANGSNSVTTFDIVLIRQAILGVNDDFPAGSWKFIPEQMELASLEDISSLSFTGVKIGDVSGASANLHSSNSQPRNIAKQSLTLLVEDQSFEAGEMIEVLFTSAQKNNIIGFQYALEFDIKTLQFLDLENTQLTNFNVSNINLSNKENGIITLSWVDIDTPINGELFKLRLKANKKGTLKDALQLSPSTLKAEAYNNEQEILDVILQFQSPNLVEAFAFPNPTTKSFTLQTYIKEAEILDIAIMDVEGKILQQIVYEAPYIGIHNIPIDLISDASGIYWIKISSGGMFRDMVKVVSSQKIH